MGVVNVTPDSFSDGGLYFNSTNALNKVKECFDNGADIIDLGGQSTRPGARLISSEEELSRIIPVLKLIRKELPNVFISIDTFYSDVASRCIDLGVDMINDISGGRFDPKILEVLANSNKFYVITHSRGNSQSMKSLENYSDILSEVFSELMDNVNEAISKGINRDKIIIDPGLGFAKDAFQNLELLSNLEMFTESKYPVLIGPSRKSFIGFVINEKEPSKRIFGTAAVICRCVQANVDIIRVHDVIEMNQTIKMANKLWY